MLKKMSLLILLVFCFYTSAEQFVVQGPYILKGEINSSIEFIKNKDESISLRSSVNGVKKDIDLYEVGDGSPKIETVFFDKIKNRRKLIVLVSWDEENISSIHYKVNVYNYSAGGILEKDDFLSKDKNLEGYDGYSGNGMIFNLKNASAIKNYLHK